AVERVIGVLYLWLVKSSQTAIIQLTKLTSKTVAKILHDSYRLIQADLAQQNMEIGGYDENGEPIVVELDESKFRKRKYHRGHHVEGVWILG
ncbi:hypothetical protein EC973_008600, partial [Apophysomyces ossiformis]